MKEAMLLIIIAINLNEYTTEIAANGAAGAVGTGGSTMLGRRIMCYQTGTKHPAHEREKGEKGMPKIDRGKPRPPSQKPKRQGPRKNTTTRSLTDSQQTQKPAWHNALRLVYHTISSYVGKPTESEHLEAEHNIEGAHNLDEGPRFEPGVQMDPEDQTINPGEYLVKLDNGMTEMEYKQLIVRGDIELDDFSWEGMFKIKDLTAITANIALGIPENEVLYVASHPNDLTVNDVIAGHKCERKEGTYTELKLSAYTKEVRVFHVMVQIRRPRNHQEPITHPEGLYFHGQVSVGQVADHFNVAIGAYIYLGNGTEALERDRELRTLQHESDQLSFVATNRRRGSSPSSSGIAGYLSSEFATRETQVGFGLSRSTPWS